MLIIVSGFHKGARWSKSFVVIDNMGSSFLLGPARFFPTKLMVQTPNSSQLLCQREECFQWFWQQLSDKYVLNSVVKTKKGTRSFQSLFVNSQVYSGFIDRAWGEHTWLDNGLFFIIIIFAFSFMGLDFFLISKTQEEEHGECSAIVANIQI